MIVAVLAMMATMTTTDLQRRIDDAAPGATVRLEAGRFVGGLVIRRSVHIVGVPGETFVDGGGRDTVVRVDGGEVTLEGVVLVRGRGRYGGALAVDNGASVRLVRCRVEDNRAKHRGGAIHVERGDVFVEDTDFLHNRAPQGGAVFAGGDASVTIVRGRAANQLAEVGGVVAAADHAHVVLRGVEFADNVARVGPEVHAIEGGMTKPKIEIAARGGAPQ